MLPVVLQFAIGDPCIPFTSTFRCHIRLLAFDVAVYFYSVPLMLIWPLTSLLAHCIGVHVAVDYFIVPPVGVYVAVDFFLLYYLLLFMLPLMSMLASCGMVFGSLLVLMCR